MKAYRQDFVAVATLITDGDPGRHAITDMTKDSMRTAFAAHAQDHEAASIRRCWSTWNVLCTFLYTGEQLTANPMQLVGRPKLSRSLPKALPRTAVEALLETVTVDQTSKRQTDWAERDLALILTGLLAGLRADELRQADVGEHAEPASNHQVGGIGGRWVRSIGHGGTVAPPPVKYQGLQVIYDYTVVRACA